MTLHNKRVTRKRFDGWEPRNTDTRGLIKLTKKEEDERTDVPELWNEWKLIVPSWCSFHLICPTNLLVVRRSPVIKLSFITMGIWSCLTRFHLFYYRINIIKVNTINLTYVRSNYSLTRRLFTTIRTMKSEIVETRCIRWYKNPL